MSKMDADGDGGDGTTQPLRVLEFYSGIGGMHAALKVADPTARVLRAFDINDTANKVYRHNFPETPVWQRLIESIPRERFEGKLQADMYLMSPPCQPFTRTGKQQGIEDKRSTSLRFILDLITTMKTPPRYILVENVKGFESSNARQPLISALQSRDYSFQEFILSPDQFGIPNSRLRYFLVAVRAPLQLPSPPTGTVLYHIPTLGGAFADGYSPQIAAHSFLPPAPQQVPGVPPVRPWTLRPVRAVGAYLSADEGEIAANLVPMKVVLRHGQLFDIVDATSHRTMCFTKAYSHYAEGTGSVVLGAKDATLEACARVFAEVEASKAQPPQPQQSSPPQSHQSSPPQPQQSQPSSSSASASASSKPSDVERPRKQAKKHEGAHDDGDDDDDSHGDDGDDMNEVQEGEGTSTVTAEATATQPTLAATDTAAVAVHTTATTNTVSTTCIDASEALGALRLRWFTPREMLTIHGFADTYTVPADVTAKQMRRCIGNGLNVVVVAELIKFMLASNPAA
ncbi:hypothetical protein PTSG_05624 [Salpingoeca rosetta]|uniref:S-adenosyl-L-methionine-dependent methyltransferase n=1 Tax=Salpingoeca rosetta (strain ATCC 50818 / BSB-021) TaxID=946362 RepID=F2UBR2_SALR5|nr:uncharacterized protein PTSG_05624 [Salpingoeca rosetta]EGD73928.1 hypothetical protein PTSG_05624 [Salpingoeca rosetta]|eukprot:XP_004993491.1 hypothetical protein PTSG_05624 [Salpingoeca rosetta]